MKILFVYMGDILHCPPAISMIQILDVLGHEVHVCIDQLSDHNPEKYFLVSKRVKLVQVGDVFEKEKPLYNKMVDMFIIKEKIWKYYKAIKDRNSLIWVLSSGSIKYLGKRLLNEKYILHLLELTEELYMLESRHLGKLSRDYSKQAAAIIECEYNRAHITKAWWKLKKLPYIIPNKPYLIKDIHKNSAITSRNDVKKIIDSLLGKKIVLYQGNMSKERPLDNFIRAVCKLGDPYVFVAMTNSVDPYPELNSNNYYHIPFVAPPYHLEVTSHAYIGILSYMPVKNDYSILNTLYCAPNKTWEYAKFGIPMIGNDLPALKYLFNTHINGICINSKNTNEIIGAIETIDRGYMSFSAASTRYFESIDLNEEVKKILDDVDRLK